MAFSTLRAGSGRMIHLASPSYSLRGMVTLNQQSCDKPVHNPHGLMTNP